MRVLIIGGGGREHALAWKMAQSPRVESVFVAPGNAGTQLEPKVANVAIDLADIDGLLGFARDRRIDLTIPGPEAPLVAGVVDVFSAAGLRCLGPTRLAAQLEGSKSFSKAFLERYDIPTAAYRSFTEVEPALAYLRQRGAPVVVKADGLAAGKGVVLAQTLTEAEAAVRDMLSGSLFGPAGRKVVIEDLLEGEEASFIVLADGNNVLPLASSQDHKAREEGDQGPNTGGMGAYSPAPVITPELHERIMHEVIVPTIAGMAEENCPYSGFLYAGLMIAADGTPNVLEYNCRLGDPETQPIIMRLESELVELCEAAVAGQLDTASVQWREQVALGVVMVADGYPGAYRKGDPIHGLKAANSSIVKVFHAGTRNDHGQVVTAGGRVLCVTALGNTVARAGEAAYAAVDQIHWQGGGWRRDIGYRAIAREKAASA